jgi:hypothetical protein
VSAATGRSSKRVGPSIAEDVEESHPAEEEGSEEDDELQQRPRIIGQKFHESQRSKSKQTRFAPGARGRDPLPPPGVRGAGGAGGFSAAPIGCAPGVTACAMGSGRRMIRLPSGGKMLISAPPPLCSATSLSASLTAMKALGPRVEFDRNSSGAPVI